MAIEDAHLALRNVAQLFDAVLYDSAESYAAPRAGPQRYLFMTSPYDLRLWRQGDDINLVCLTDNKAQTFWAFIAEKMGDEALKTRAASWKNASRLAEEFAGAKVATLPCGGTITLQHASIPAHFDIELVGSYGVPEYQEKASVSSHAKARLREVRKALTSRNNLSSEAIRAYDTLRQWAGNTCLLSRSLGPLTLDLLTDMIISLRHRDDIFQAFLDTYSQPESITAFLDGTKERSSGARLIAQEASRARDNQSRFTATMQQHSAWFLTDYELFVELSCRCWTDCILSTAWNRATETAKSLMLPLVLAGKCTSIRIWPLPFATQPSSAAVSSETTIVLLVGVFSQDPNTLSQLTKMLEAEMIFYTSKHFAELETEDYQLTFRVQPFSGVRMYVPTSLPQAEGSETTRNTPSSQSVIQTRSSDGDSAKVRLRTGGQALSRLRWDPKHRSHKYEVGYTDRFLNELQWMAIEDWGKPTEDEEFIPEHRMQQMREVETKRVVWNRALRLDDT